MDEKPERLARLCPTLKTILTQELTAGNSIVDVTDGWPHSESIFVLLHHEFQTRIDPLPAGIRVQEVNDPHWWKTEYIDEANHHCLACRFGSPAH